MNYTMDDILETLVNQLAGDLGGTRTRSANFTGDDGNGVANHLDVAQLNIFNTNGAGVATIGGRDSSGTFRFVFSNEATAQDFNTEIKGVVKDFTTILTRDGVNDSDIIEQILVRAAEAFGGSRIGSGGDLDGDNFGDSDDFRGTGVSIFGGDRDGIDDGVRLTGRDASGQIEFQFDDAATAEAFLAVARLINSWGAENF